MTRWSLGVLIFSAMVFVGGDDRPGRVPTVVSAAAAALGYTSDDYGRYGVPPEPERRIMARDKQKYRTYGKPSLTVIGQINGDMKIQSITYSQGRTPRCPDLCDLMTVTRRCRLLAGAR